MRPKVNRVGRRRLLRSAAVGTAGGLLLAACGGDGQDGGTSSAGSTTGGAAATGVAQKEPVRGGALTSQIGGDPPNFDLHANSTILVNTVAAPIYNTLVQFDPAKPDEAPDTIVADLAKSWEQSGDGLVYTFKLQDGVTFHDGTRLSATDVTASLNRMVNPPAGTPSPRQDSLKIVDKMETPDASTVVLTLKQPAPSLLPILAQSWMAIYAEKDIAGGFDFKLKTNGTGPFKLKEYVRGNRVLLEANPSYWVQGQPYLSGITAFIMTDAGARVSSFQSGEVVFSASFSVSDIDSLQSALRDRLVVEKRNSFIFGTISFGAGAPWRDERVRRAVSLMMDRESAIDLLSEGDATVGGYMPANGAWSLPEGELRALPGYAPTSEKTQAEAKALLAAAGVRDGHETTILTRRGTSGENFSVFIKDQLAKVGIDAKPQVMEDAVAYDALNNRAFDLAPWVHGIALDDPDTIFAEFYITGAPRNYSEISTPEVDALFTRQSQTLDAQERQKLVKELQQRALPLFGKVIVDWRMLRWARWNTVQGYTAHVGYYNNNRHAGTWLDKS